MQAKLAVEGDRSGAKLNLSLTNESGEALTVYRHALPWVGSSSILLIAAQTDRPGTLLEKTLPVDDPGPEQVTIAPGVTVSGTIALPQRFPGFEEALRSRDVVVFWSYQCVTVAGQTLPRTSGAVLFPVTGTGTA